MEKSVKKDTRGGNRKGAGRHKGGKNVRTLEAMEKLKNLDCDPLHGMAKLARLSMEKAEELEEEIKNASEELTRAGVDSLRRDKTAFYTMAGNMYKELAQYVAPKRRAIEHSGDISGNIVIRKVKRFDGTTD